MSLTRIIVALVLLAPLARAEGKDPVPAKERRPNVLLIFVDDLGYADLGCQGMKDIPTPAIDSIAACGVRFTNAYVTAARRRRVSGPRRDAISLRDLRRRVEAVLRVRVLRRVVVVDVGGALLRLVPGDLIATGAEAIALGIAVLHQVPQDHVPGSPDVDADRGHGV